MLFHIVLYLIVGKNLCPYQGEGAKGVLVVIHFRINALQAIPVRAQTRTPQGGIVFVPVGFHALAQNTSF